MSTVARCAALLACATVMACGDASTAPITPAVQSISGNWYLTDASAPPSAGQLNEIGVALQVQNGSVTGNATVAISDASGQCASYGLDLTLTGAVDPKSQHLILNATDNIDTLSLNAILAPTHAALASGSYHAIGLESYPQTSPAESPCSTPSGKLDGILMAPVSASYVGTLRTSGGANVTVSLTTRQDTVPLTGMSYGARPAIITHGNMVFLVGGFAVTGTMQLSHSVCGVTTGKIQPQNGYVWGTVLQIEFDTDSSYQKGATFDTYIDPTTGALTVVSGGLYNAATASPCSADFVPGGTLSRQG